MGANAAIVTSLLPTSVPVPDATTPADTTKTTSAPGVGYNSIRGETGGVVKGARPCGPCATNDPSVYT